MENNSPIHIDQKVDYHNHVDTAEILHYLKRIFKEVDMAEERLTAVLANEENTKESLITITNKLNQFMATNQERFDQLNTRLDTITNNIAEDYATLLAAVGKDAITEESFAKHEANITRLEGLGASVDNPVPVEPPVEPPVG